ncbi:MAG: hypothetical protein Q7R22_002080 [Verrucomicrobiota bacterium JB025]|nr:hypothetical protein [Verrucomicrobiota bacterium JB025]
MKTAKLVMILGLLLMVFAPAQEVAQDERLVLVPWKAARTDAPLFFSATAEVDVRVGLEEVTGEQRISFMVHQGKAEELSLELSGPGEVTEVSGKGLKDWSVRMTDGKRFLDLRPAVKSGRLPRTLEVSVKTRLENEGGMVGILLPGAGRATGFAVKVAVQPDKGVDLKVLEAAGLAKVEDGEWAYVGGGSVLPKLVVGAAAAGVDSRGLELAGAVLEGNVAEDGKSVSFVLKGVARSAGEGSRIELLGGGAALADGVAGEDWHVELKKRGKEWVYELVADFFGDLPVEVGFEVAVQRQGDWSGLSFRVPGGVVVPVTVRGLDKGVSFDAKRAVVPQHVKGAWMGFLPANGQAEMAWREVDKVADGSLFFSSTATSDVRVGSGLLRQQTVMDLRVLQGKLAELTIKLDGPGEVLSVAGEPVLGWVVRETDGVRELDVKLSRPIEGAGRIRIEAQAALGGFPVKAEALRMSPVGALRHSGYLRIANHGAVRVEVGGAKGLIQLAPEQFPGGVDESLRQVFVYRFPSAEYGYSVDASQVLPEVGVTEVTVYEMSETDMRIAADLELDIREAPLREWELMIPADHAVAAVSSAAVADYSVGEETEDGLRRLKVIFGNPVSGRQLVKLRLEKNEAAKAGAWQLTPLGFPKVKSRRGYVGAVAAAGYRLVVGKTAGLAEVPLTFFPKKTQGLQQAFRLRDDKWSAGLVAEALGQSVEADVFHLYSLKSGAVYGSVLMNFFVVGAPATEWRVEVPEGIGNIDVTGQNVGRDWRRDGNVVIVPLSSPVLGAGTLLLTFEQPMNSMGGTFSPGEVKPLGVQGERGYVQVVSPLQVKHESTSEGGLLEIDASELPTEFRLLTSAPTLRAWQYTAREFAIEMNVEWFEPGETVGQVVDFQKLSTRLSRDGQWVTEARVFVKSRGRSVLRTVFPEGAVLWEAKVDGKAVNARKDAGETLVPLPSRVDPNQAVEVVLRYGAKADSARRAKLVAPVIDAPVVIGEWTVSGDEGRQLVPKGGTADLVRPVLAETGWEWLAGKRRGAGLLFVVGLAAVLLAWRCESVLRRGFAIGAGAGFVVLALGLAVAAASGGRGHAEVLEYAAPVVAAGGEVSVVVANVPQWAAGTNAGVWLGGLAGLGLAAWGVVKRQRMFTGAGVALLAAAVLFVHGGAAWFFVVLALIGFVCVLPEVFKLALRLKKKPVAAPVGTAVVMLSCLLTMGGTGAELAESMIHDWEIRDGRLHGTVEVTVRGETGERFLLLRDPAVLSDFAGDGLRVVKSPAGEATAYWLEAEVAGRLTGRATFEMPLADPLKGWHMPSGQAAMQKVRVRWDEAGWEFVCPAAAKVDELAGTGKAGSGASMVIGPVEHVMIRARAKQRDVTGEETKFYAEVSNLYLPGPGVVNGRHQVRIRPSQGRVTSLRMRVPDGFTVSDVLDGPVGSWRFDPEGRELRMTVEPAQTKGFGFVIETQRGAGELPVDLALGALRVEGSAGEVGLLGLAFGNDVQPESVAVEGMTRVNPEDFGNGLLPVSAKGRALAVLQHAFRYGAEDVTAKVRVSEVAPELRAEISQLVSLGEDRLVVAADLRVNITRSGVFRLDVEVPAGLEIESATGEGLSHWAEVSEDGKRVLVLHLAGKTMGLRNFNLTLAGRPTGTQKKWTVPRMTVRGASRETGVLTIVPERGLQVRAVERNKVSQLDPRELADAGKQQARAAVKPGALAYRLLQGDWSLGLAISRLDPWVTARVFHDATIREGQLLSRVNISYKIENAAVKTLRVRIPGLDESSAATVRATGAAVADLVPVAGEDGLYEIRFQRGLAGSSSVDLEYQRAGADGGTEKVEPVALEDVRQLSYFVAVRAGGRLELEEGEVPRGWRRADWAVLKSNLGSVAGGVTPNLSYRVADAGEPLQVVLKRHELAALRKMRVSEGSLTTLLSPNGGALTAVDLKMEVVAKSTLRLRLPKGAELFNVRVNGEGTVLVREGDEWLFHVFPATDADEPSNVGFVYSAPLGKRGSLVGPLMDVPMENLSWRVLVPEGWTSTGHDGDFDLLGEEAKGGFGLQDYLSLSVLKSRSDKKNAVELLDKANKYMLAGDQEKASKAFSNAVNNGFLDAASGEDARVQLRQLKTQQAVLGLNTRRQKIELDNRIEATSFGQQAQIEQAANVNPVFQGRYNYDPQQFDRFLAGNTADENAALKEVANRIVAQQLAAEPAAAALDVTLPERGTVLTFGRSVQGEVGRPMEIRLKLRRANGGFAAVALALCALVGAMAAVTRKK